MTFLDGSFVLAKSGGEGGGLTRKCKGTKWMLVADRNGLPLGIHLASAACAEIQLATTSLDTISVTRPGAHPRRRPEKLVADRAYDSSAFRSTLRRRGKAMCIPPKRRPTNWKAKRGRLLVTRKEEYRRLGYTVELSFAWLGNCRRLLIRWERFVGVYCSFFAVALMLPCLRSVVRDTLRPAPERET